MTTIGPNSVSSVSDMPTKHGTVRLRSGDTLQNVKLGGGAKVFATGDGWTIRNVVKTSPGAFDSYVFGVRTSGGTGRIENCYVDIPGNGADNSVMGVWAHPKHAGEIHVRNSHFAGCGDNALYCSAPGNGRSHPSPGNGGVVTAESCYFTNNAVSDVRLGTNGSYAHDCVMTSRESSNGGENVRSYWGYYGKTRAVDCDMHGKIRAGESSWPKSATVTLKNCRGDPDRMAKHDSTATFNGTVRSSPRNRSVGPQSPAEVVSGASAEGLPPLSSDLFASVSEGMNALIPEGGLPNSAGRMREITFSGHGAYSFQVTDGIEPTETVNTQDGTDEIGGKFASGTLAGGRDTYRFSGEVVSQVITPGVDVDAPESDVETTTLFEGALEELWDLARGPSELGWVQWIGIAAATLAGLYLGTQVAGNLIGKTIGGVLRNA